jgi:hypothetical protein
MKIAGRKIEGPNVITLVLPREDGQDIVIKAQAVLDMDDFDNNYPAPLPPTIVYGKSGEIKKDVDDPAYKKKLESHNTKRFSYMILKSLEATPELEWETVNMADPETWGNYESELKEAGFSNAERNRISMAVFDANALNETKLKEALARFIKSQTPTA